jgi:hypothetical protein
MTWSYSGDPSASSKDAVRFLSGDTDSAWPLCTNEEILYVLGQQSNVTLAAAEVCDAIATKFSRQADTTNGKTSISASQRAQAYSNRAVSLRQQASSDGAPAFFVGGLSRSGKVALDSDSDAVQPAFSIGMDDLPGSATDSKPDRPE